MADLRVDQLTIYPIKSLGGISVRDIRVTWRGPDLDRRWSLVDDQGVVVTQREMPVLSQCIVRVAETDIIVDCKGRNTTLPKTLESGDSVSVRIWGDTVVAIQGPEDVADWFSDLVGFRCRPVFMPETEVRRVNPFFAPDESYTTFTDGFPILLASTASLADLNRRLDSPVPMSRFRANVVVSGGQPYSEDAWGKVELGGATIRGVKPCSRCAMTTIDSESLLKQKEPLRTLSTYRKWGNHVYFAENFLVEEEGLISVNDQLVVKSTRSSNEVIKSRI